MHALVTSITATVTMQSPDGTVFAPGQETLAVAYRKPGGDWPTSASLALRDGVRSADGRTITYTLQTGSSFSLPPDSFLRWEPVVRVAADAPAGNSALEIVAEGNAH